MVNHFEHTVTPYFRFLCLAIMCKHDIIQKTGSINIALSSGEDRCTADCNVYETFYEVWRRDFRGTGLTHTAQWHVDRNPLHSDRG